MNLERYSRQTQLTAFGIDAQNKLLAAKVLVIGAGGLGIPVLTYLNAMGVGTLGIVDNDVVSLSNLHRQVSFCENEIGKLKVEVLVAKLTAQNPTTNLISHHTFLTIENAIDIIEKYDLVVDASDNFPTRYLVNDACVILKKPFIYGALHSFEGQVSVFNYQNGPTYRCLFPTMPNSIEIPNCDENGVLGVIPGIIGNLQALEAVKVITGVGEVLSGKLVLFDGLNQNYQKIKFSKVDGNDSITTLKNNYDFECDLATASIDADDFQSLLKSKEVQIVDVRTKEEFENFHLDASLHIPLAELEHNYNKLDFSAAIYVICQSGIRSQKAIQTLNMLQPTAKLINVNGGINKMNRYAVK